MRKMLKSTLLSGAFIVSSVAVHAQLHLGLRGGLLSGSANYSEIAAGQTIRNRTGVLGSVLAEYRFNDGFAIQPEVSWVQRGWENSLLISIPFLGSQEQIYREKINYLEIPVLVKAGFAFGPARLDLLAGPSFSWAVNGKETSFVKTTNGSGQTTINNETSKDIDFDQDFEKADLGLQGGAALSVTAGSARIFVDGRYLYGVKDLSKGDDVKVSSKGVALSAGVLFGF